MRNDCFANRGCRCAALETKNCSNCKFYKSKSKYAADRLKYLDKEAAFLKMSDFDKERFKKILELCI